MNFMFARNGARKAQALPASFVSQLHHAVYQMALATAHDFVDIVYVQYSLCSRDSFVLLRID